MIKEDCAQFQYDYMFHYGFPYSACDYFIRIIYFLRTTGLHCYYVCESPSRTTLVYTSKYVSLMFCNFGNFIITELAE